MNRLGLLSLIIALLCGTVAAFAGLPQNISYQGYVKGSATGVPVNGSVPMTFSLYSSTRPASGAVWSETQSVNVSNGIYSVQLGAASPNQTINALFDVPYWLGVNVNNSSELPRQPLSSTGYAFRAGVANALAAGATVPGAIPTTTTGSTNLTAITNTGYLLTNATPGTVTLPGSANVGDVIKLDAVGAGGITVVLANGQTISGQGVYPDYSAWVPHGPYTYWYGIASSADGTKLVAVVNNGQIYTSTDSGATWTARDSARYWRSVASSADGTKLVAVVANWQIYTSTDSGATWTARDSARYWSSVASSADGTKLVAAVYGGQIYTSTDSGATWTARDSARYWNSVTSSADGTKLVAVVENGQIYTSTDSGTTWTARDSDRAWTSVASSADGTKLVAAVFNGQIYTSTDSGATWAARDSARYWRSVASSADGTKLIAGINNNGQIYTSTDSGATWVARDSTRVWSSVAISADGSRLAAAVYNGNIYLNSTSQLNLPQYGTAELIYTGNGQWLVNRSGSTGTGNTSSGTSSSIAGGNGNSATDSFAVIGGGGGNSATAYGSSVGGGVANMASGTGSFVGGGASNTASVSYSTVGGGVNNTASNSYSTVGGGAVNTASSSYSTVGGGTINTASGHYSTIGGGGSNTASGYYSTVGGGGYNTASGWYSLVPGGVSNTAGGQFSFAAGRQAVVRDGTVAGNGIGDQGTFVWSDAQGTVFASTGQNQFLVRAAGGVGINKNNPSPGTLDVNGNAIVSGSLSAGSSSLTGDMSVGGNTTVSGNLSMGSTTRQMLNLWGTVYGLGVQNYTLYSRSDGGFAWYKGGTHNTSTNDPGTGGTALMALNENGYLGLGTAAPNRHLHLSRAAGTEFNMEMSDGLSNNRVWNFAVHGAVGTGPKLEFRIMNDTGSAVTRSVLSLYNNGNAEFTGTVTANGTLLTSDLRLKTDIQPLEDTLAKVLRLRGVSYVMKADESKERKIGVIAQELEQEYPELVNTDDKGMKSVAYANLTAVLIEAVKGQQQIIKSQDERINLLEKQLAEIRTLLGR